MNTTLRTVYISHRDGQDVLVASKESPHFLVTGATLDEAMEKAERAFRLYESVVETSYITPSATQTRIVSHTLPAWVINQQQVALAG